MVAKRALSELLASGKRLSGRELMLALRAAGLDAVCARHSAKRVGLMDEHGFDAYRIEMRLDGGAFVAWLAELPQLLVEARSAGHAVELLREGFEIWAREVAEDGRALPEPWGDSEPSGRILLRIPSSLHARLASEAEHQAVSLNSLLNVILADAVGFARGKRAADPAATTDDSAATGPRRPTAATG